MLVLLRGADWAFGLVIVWAYLGIAVRQDDPVAVIAALIGAIIVAALIGSVLWQRRRGLAAKP